MGIAENILKDLDAEKASKARREVAEKAEAAAVESLNQRKAELQTIGIEAVSEREAIIKLRQRREEAEKEAAQALHLMNLRKKALGKIIADTENYLADVETRALESLSHVDSKIAEAMNTLHSLEQFIEHSMSSAKSAMDRIIKVAQGIITGAEKLLGKTETIHKNAESAMEHLKSAENDLNKKILSNSNFEKSIKAREKQVEIKSREADQKLKEAQDLAYWHKQPGATYKGP